MSNLTWYQSDIHQALIKRNSPYTENVRNLLHRPDVMPKIVAILDLGGATPKDFTLHNADHSFRVAQRMWQVVPDVTKAVFSDYELGLLLLSAYLHDIGMSPEHDKVRHHQIFLTERKDGVLSEAEINEFQQWIDNDPMTGDLDIRKGLVGDTNLANYILSYYIRHKHNDWSGDWIRNNLGNEKLAGYPRWVSDLILICKSHHYGLDHLLHESFDPYPLSSGSAVHLRYLAMCLRIADVMENDPDRTPEVLVTHRQISAGSLSFWLKDHQFSLVRKRDTYTLHARPERAFIHKAIEETADLIERELKLCDELARRKPLAWSPLMNLGRYEWTIDPVLIRDIHPLLDSYEYIQGSFRPNTARILELLGGHQLYGDAIWAYRELIQNAFDAVKERIAYKLIYEKSGLNKAALNIGEAFSIDLSLVEKEDGIWLICKDHGVGMTKSIIETYFLRSGFSKRHEIKELERECRKNGFNLGRTGQFGIGVLSYFMLAEKIVVKTKREFKTGYQPADSIAWKFEINGTHDFGELAKYDPGISGTQLEFKLKHEVAAKIAEWDDRFQKFLKDNILRTPCILNYSSFLGSKATMVPGWTNRTQDIKDRMQEQARFHISIATKLTKDSPDMISSHKREEQKLEKLFVEDLLRDLENSLDFFSTEGQFNDYIHYRIHIPYFKLGGGNSFFFLKETIEGDLHYVEGFPFGHVWAPDMHSKNYAIKGVRVEIPMGKDEKAAFPSAYVELDFEAIDELKLDISRRNFELDRDLYEDLVRKIDREINRLIKQNEACFDNCYGLLNCQYADFVPREFYWFFHESGGLEKYLLKKIEFPLLQRRLSREFVRFMVYRDEDLNPCLNHVAHYNYYGFNNGTGFIPWEGRFKFFYETGLLPEEKFRIYPILMNRPTALLKDKFHEIDLPEEWNKVIMMRCKDDEFSMLNTGHPLFHLHDPDLVNSINGFGLGDAFPDTDNEAACFNFLIVVLSRCSSDEWIAIFEKYPDKLEKLFATLKLGETMVLTEYELAIFGIGSFKSLRFADDIGEVLPEVWDDEYYYITCMD